MERLVKPNRASKHSVGQAGETSALINSAKDVANLYRPTLSTSTVDNNVGICQAHLTHRSVKLSRDSLKSLYRSFDVISTCGRHFVINSKRWLMFATDSPILTYYII